ncbi:MAG: HzsA-related protein [Planctomycetota bacterium]
MKRNRSIADCINVKYQVRCFRLRRKIKTLSAITQLYTRICVMWCLVLLVLFCSVNYTLSATTDNQVEAEFTTIKKLITQFQTDDKVRKRWEAITAQTFRHESLILPSDRNPLGVVLRRTSTLLAHLKAMPGAPNFSAEETQLAQLETDCSKIAVQDNNTRYRFFEKVLRLRRKIAFSNPLLNFDRILFIKRQFLSENATWDSNMRGNHMCDQYFGFHAIAGGGLFVLENPFGEKPTIRNILADSVCENGRFKGRMLKPGGFLSPELSFDGKTILFAYTEAEPTRYEWTENSTFHIFKVNIDGSGLVQLTDGPVNDFDPCWLPDGRIIFISERRGGYGRCHPRPVPLYTLYRMNADGSNIIRISHHEANEWQPSLDHNGMVLYTRWDYVDRGNIQAHHPWITAPDGRDARAIQGNFGKSKTARPTMELDIRAIPGSHKYIATAAAHHGQSYGSLILIDPRTKDDDSMAPVRRITPEAPFPEAEINFNYSQLYASPWPLSEHFYLCVYDADGSARRGKENNYGIYLVDAFGNKELIYRDPAISCTSPIPLRPRKKPPLLAGTTVTPEQQGLSKPQTAPVGVANVYNSLYPFPEGTTIKALRIIQVLPKTTPLIDEPRIGYGNEKGARAVLGTVPVEADGSAYFNLPVRKPVYFQVLDERGLAVQSMRSDTYIDPGQRLFCRGCHEPRHSAPLISKRLPLAFRRLPSRIQPDVEGSNPFSFPRLVQPVLERNCVTCHEKEPEAPDLRKGNWKKNRDYRYTSYDNLREYTFFFGSTRNKYDPWTTSRTIPGEFGARASKLYKILSQGHHEVKLSEEDFHRITLWLDCNSDFFGSYDNTYAQARGDIILPILE